MVISLWGSLAPMWQGRGGGPVCPLPSLQAPRLDRLLSGHWLLLWEGGAWGVLQGSDKGP